MLCLKDPRSSSLPFCRQSLGVPLVLLGSSSKEGDGEGVEVEFFQDVLDRIGPFAALVDAMKRLGCGLH